MKTLKPTIATIIITIILISCGNPKDETTEKQMVPLEEKALVKKDTAKQMNILDEQAKLLNKVFGDVDTEEGRAFKKANNYLDLVEQANFPTDVKKNLQDQYKLYELSLDPKKKDSLKLMFNEKLNEAMVKSRSNPQ